MFKLVYRVYVIYTYCECAHVRACVLLMQNDYLKEVLNDLF